MTAKELQKLLKSDMIDEMSLLFLAKQIQTIFMHILLHNEEQSVNDQRGISIAEMLPLNGKFFYANIFSGKLVYQGPLLKPMYFLNVLV